MTSEILVFDRGYMVFRIKREDLNVSEDAIIGVLDVEIDNEIINVMYMSELDYGIVISKSMSEKIRRN